jgi:hypothetical protein
MRCEKDLQATKKNTFLFLRYMSSDIAFSGVRYEV